MNLGNLFADIPGGPLSEELVNILWQTPNLRVERIVSHGHATPPGQWYDQDEDEWVVLLTGSAGLRIDGRAEIMDMQPGDFIMLPAHVRHRVECTDANGATVWLAIHTAEKS